MISWYTTIDGTHLGGLELELLDVDPLAPLPLSLGRGLDGAFEPVQLAEARLLLPFESTVHTLSAQRWGKAPNEHT